MSTKNYTGKTEYFPKKSPSVYTDLIIQSNQLTSAKYNLDLVDKRILYLIIDRVRNKFVERKNDENTKVDLFGNMIISFKSSDLGEVDNITRLYSKLSNFKSKTIEINEENVWTAIGIVNYVRHYKKENTIELEVSKELLPHLLDLSSQFTAYSLSVAISFKSLFTQRFYELCQRWKGKGYFFYSVDDLKEMFEINDQYKKFSDLKRFVIDKAKKELFDSFHSQSQPSSDIYFNWQVKEKSGKMGNKNHILEFFIYDQKQDLYGNWILADYQYNIKLLLNKYFVNDTGYISRILSSLNSIAYANKMFVKLQDKEAYYKNEARVNTKDVARIIRTIIKEDFNIH